VINFHCTSGSIQKHASTWFLDREIHQLVVVTKMSMKTAKISIPQKLPHLEYVCDQILKNHPNNVKEDEKKRHS